MPHRRLRKYGASTRLTRDAAETFAKCSNQAMKTVSNRMGEGLKELHSLIKTDRTV